jgi:hypothetical protein
MMKSGSTPYRWFWGVGVLCLFVAVIMAVQGAALWMPIVMALCGVQLVLGFVERRRGAPPLCSVLMDASSKLMPLGFSCCKGHIGAARLASP